MMLEKVSKIWECLILNCSRRLILKRPSCLYKWCFLFCLQESYQCFLFVLLKRTPCSQRFNSEDKVDLESNVCRQKKAELCESLVGILPCEIVEGEANDQLWKSWKKGLQTVNKSAFHTLWSRGRQKIKRKKSQRLCVWFSSWWFQIYVGFHPKYGEMMLFDEHIFQMGWFNHQLVMVSWDQFSPHLLIALERQAAPLLRPTSVYSDLCPPGFYCAEAAHPCDSSLFVPQVKETEQWKSSPGCLGFLFRGCSNYTTLWWGLVHKHLK